MLFEKSLGPLVDAKIARDTSRTTGLRRPVAVKRNGKVVNLGRWTPKCSFNTEQGAKQAIRAHFKELVGDLWETRVIPRIEQFHPEWPKNDYNSEHRLKDGGPWMSWSDRREFMKSFWKIFYSMFEIVPLE